MAALFACILGNRRGSTSLSETSDFTRNTQGSQGSSSQTEIVYVELLRRTNEPLGLKLGGGTDHDRPVYVMALHAGGVAEQSNALQIGDRILSINGTPTDHLTNSEVKGLLDNAGNVVNLEIAFEEGGQKLDDGMELKTAMIALPREDNGFGFFISGGYLENRAITVSHVKQNSYPYKKGILRAGDRILQINRHDMRAASQTQALEVLKMSEDTCSLLIEYDVTLHEGLEETNGPLIVELQKPHGASLGISLRGDPNPGEPIWISRVREAGIADRSGALHVGDRLLSIDGKQLDNRTLQEARYLLSHSDIHVKLEITPVHNFVDMLPVGVSPVDDAQSDVSSYTSQNIGMGYDSHRRPSQLSLTSIATSSAHVLYHPEVMCLTLHADQIGFGMSIQGGANDYGNLPVVIASIDPDGPAGVLGQLQVGDRILSINGVPLEGATINQATKLLQEGNGVVDMEVEFDVTDGTIPTSGTYDVNLAKSGCLTLGISINSTEKQGEKIWISSLKKGGLAYRVGSLQPGDIILAINGESLENATHHDAIELLQGSEDTITLTMMRAGTNDFSTPKNGHKSDTVIYSVELDRGGGSLGICLDGSQFVGQPIIISEIKEGGVAQRTGALKVGDRILAINTETMLDKTIDDAYRILKESGDTVTLKISKGVGRNRKKTRPGFSGKYHRPYYKNNQRYHINHSILPSRVPSRFSNTSESELSTLEYMSTGTLDQPYSRYPSKRPPRSYPPHPGRHSPSNRHRHSPVGRGRVSPVRSPNRDRTRSSSKSSVLTGLPHVEPSLKRTWSTTETTDEETVFEEEKHRPHGGRNGFPPAQTNGHRVSRSPPHSAGSRDHKKPTSESAKSSEPKTTSNSAVEEAFYRQLLDDTLHKSKKFTNKLNELAVHSGSSDPESDVESSSIPFRVKDNIFRHVQSRMTPVKRDILDVTLARLPDVKGFGFSMSDGLIEGGVFVKKVEPDSPAYQSGLRPFDKIIKCDGADVKDYTSSKIKPLFFKATEITLTISRNPHIKGEATEMEPDPLGQTLSNGETDYQEEYNDTKSVDHEH